MTDQDEPESLDRQQLLDAIENAIQEHVPFADAGYLVITFDEDGYNVSGSGDPDDQFISDLTAEVSHAWDPEHEHICDECAAKEDEPGGSLN